MADYEEAFRKLYVLILIEGSHWSNWCQWDNLKVYNLRRNS